MNPSVLLDPEVAATIDRMRQPSGAPSLAAAFPSFSSRADKENRRHFYATQRPLWIRQTNAAADLAQRGAMEPEGASASTQSTILYRHHLTPAQLREILSTLWTYRLLWWLPSDTEYQSYRAISKAVAKGHHRPEDTLRFIPVPFRSRKTPEELDRYRRGFTYDMPSIEAA